MFLDLDSRESKFEKDHQKRALAAKQKLRDNERKKREYEKHQKELEGRLLYISFCSFNL